MDSSLLEYFLRVSELGSISKAAHELHLSQPALSRHISLLEHELGTSLFNRTSSGVTPTEAGVLLANRVRPILRQLYVLKEEVGEQASGQLTIGLPPSWHDIFTADFVEFIVSECPGVKLRVFEGSSNALRDLMNNGLLDIAIIPFSPNPMAGYQQLHLLREQVLLVGNKASKLKPDDEISIKDLDNRKLVLPTRPSLLRLQVEHGLWQRNLRFNLAAEADTIMLCLTLARKGVAETVVPGSSIFEKNLQRGLSWSRLKGVFLTWMLCEKETRTHIQAVRVGKETVMKLINEKINQSLWLGAEATQSSDN